MKKVVEICHLNIDLSELNTQVDHSKYIHNHHEYTDYQKQLLADLNTIKEVSNIYLLQTTDVRGKNYLLERGFDEALLKELQFGFLPKEHVQKMIDGKTIPVERLIATGFIRFDEEHQRYYPTYGDRVLIPIFDERGNIVTFSGRAIFGEEPKYLHGHNTEIFTKSNQLYNYHRAKDFAYGDKIYVVEGFMDVAGGNRLGIKNIVATMGTSFSKEQLDMIRRLNCEIVLVRDNDKAGKNAMLKEIPELLNQGFRVSAIDLNEVKQALHLSEDVESKDLWDFANAGASETDLRKNTKTGFHFLIQHQYLTEKIDTNTIRHAYDELKRDGYIKTQADEMSFKDFVEEHSTYSRQEVQAILSDEPIKDSPLTLFQDNLVKQFIHQNTVTYIKEHGDSTMKSFYEEQYDILVNQMHNRFKEEPSKYLSDDFSKILIDNLVNDTFAENERWKKLEILQNFQHDNIFNDVYVMNKNGQVIPLKLNSEQKREVTKQFDQTLSDDIRLSMGNVDELYIYNSISDLDRIIGLSDYKKCEVILKSMKQQCMMRDTIMHVFSFENIFDKDMLPFVDSKFKSKDGQRYKKILLFDNRIEKIQITKNTVKKELPHENVVDREKEIESVKLPQHEEKSKTYHFTINRVLIKKTYNDKYFVRVPGTEGTKFMYIPIENTHRLSDKTMEVSLPITDTIEIFNRNEEYLEKMSFSQVTSFWEKKEEKDYLFKSHKKNESKKSFFNFKKKKPPIELPKIEPFKGHEISSSRIIQKDDKSFQIQSNLSGYRLLIPKDYIVQMTNSTYQIKDIRGKSTPQGSISDVMLAKETSEGLELHHYLAFNELDKHLCSNKNTQMLLLIVDEKKITKQENNQVRIPIYKDHKYGYVSVDKNVLMKLDDTHYGLTLSPYHELQMFTKNAQKLGFVTAKDLPPLYEEALKERIDFEQDLDYERR